jgi:outer membrane protein OmpA-like peptidoglycan-associated protein
MYVALGVGIAIALGLLAWIAVGRFQATHVVAAAKHGSPATSRSVPPTPSARKSQPPPQAAKPLLKFDVARIDPEGASVFAGSAGPNQRVTILLNGREFASAVADEDGQWAVVVERPVPSGRVELGLVATGPEQGRTDRGQVVHMTVAAPRVAATPPPEARPHKIAQPLPPRPQADSKADSKQALRQFEEFVERARAAAPAVPAAPEASAAPAVPVVHAPIPVPITFHTDEAVMTPDGDRAAQLLADYLRITKPQSISLSGHADSRGPDGYNMDLSRRRLGAIERYLRTAGYKGGLTLVPLGETVPYQVLDRNKLTLAQRYQLDRRVELQVTGAAR